VIDFNFENTAELKPGSVLVSEPFLADDYFTRSVIFLCDHNDEGSFGFVLNKYVENNLTDFVKDFPDTTARVGLGGPVDTSNLFYIHSIGEKIPNSIPCSNGLFIGGDFEKLKEILLLDPSQTNRIRFFIGYSGWDKGQLTHELNEKSWIVLNDTSQKLILDTSNENIWKEVMQNLGGKFKVMSQFPINPSDN